MKIVILDDVEQDVIDRLKKLGEVAYMPKERDRELADANVIVVRSITKVNAELLAKAPKVKIAARAGVGVDNFDFAECEKRRVKVINTPGASTVAVAELAVGLMIALLRKIPKADWNVRNKVWKRGELVGDELYGKTLGIIGFGRIGRAVAERAKAFGMRILAYDIVPVKSEIARGVDLNALLANSDIITLHASLSRDKDKGFVNKELIGKMKNGVYLINTARGAFIDEDALYDALKSGKLAGAALDTMAKEPYEGKLVECENVIFSSHTGANTHEAQSRIGVELAEKIMREFVK